MFSSIAVLNFVRKPPQKYMLTLQDFNVKRESFDLSSGAHVVLFNRPKMPVHILVTFIAGSRFDPVGKEGLAHFIEHILLAGTTTYPTKDLLAGFIEDLGGSIGASTGADTLNLNVALGDPADLNKIDAELDAAMKDASNF